MKAHSAHRERIFIVIMDTYIIGLAHFLSAVTQMIMFLDDKVATLSWGYESD